MSRLKKMGYNLLRFEIRPVKDKSMAPQVTLFLHEFEADKRGDMVGAINLAECKDRDEIVRLLGEKVLEHSWVIREWIEKQSAETE